MRDEIAGSGGRSAAGPMPSDRYASAPFQGQTAITCSAFTAKPAVIDKGTLYRVILVDSAGENRSVILIRAGASTFEIDPAGTNPPIYHQREAYYPWHTLTSGLIFPALRAFLLANITARPADFYGRRF